MSRFAVVVAVVGACLLGLADRPAAQAQRNSGVSTACGEFTIALDLFFFTIPIVDKPDEGWAWVDPTRKLRQATGTAHDVVVAASDTPANHESHDLDFKIRLDPGQEDLLSIQPDDSMPIEWESGIAPWEKSGDGANPIFPKWAWPSAGDRVWVDGHWIHDCGHPQEGTGLYRTEIHPARAIASMRERAATLPGTGTTPVPVTLTDLYISGRGGYVTEQLNCGLDIILGPDGNRCGQPTPPADESYKTTPINDTDFTFSVCLPPRPSSNAVISSRVDPGPRNTVGIAPRLEYVPTGAHCLGDPGYDQGQMMRVTVPLDNTTTPPDAVYARRIYAGWLVPPDPVLPRRLVTLESTDLHEDHDLDPGDGELTFWWMNVDLAESGWQRLSDFADGNMDDYDDDFSVGDGIMTFSNANFDFYMRAGQSFAVNSMGYEQDCFDNLFNGTFFGHHQLELIMYIVCYGDFSDAGAGDAIERTRVMFSDDDLGPRTITDNDEYDIRINIEEVATTTEDTSYLSIYTACTPSGEVALVGEPLTCATEVHNAGTGLPRQVRISNQFSGPPFAAVSAGTWSIRPPFGNGTYPCSIAGSDALCSPDTVPVAARTPVNVTTITTPMATGLLTERAEVTTASTDPDLTNNVASTTIEVFRSVMVDVSPRTTDNEINLGRGGTVTVAILTTADFDAAAVDPLSVCFGDGGAPGERSCAEQHQTGHLEDVNKDKLLDLVLHFDVASTGIDLGDPSACLRGRTLGGVGLYGCDAILTK